MTTDKFNSELDQLVEQTFTDVETALRRDGIDEGLIAWTMLRLRRNSEPHPLAVVDGQHRISELHGIGDTDEQ